MALLLVNLHTQVGTAQQWRAAFGEQLPDLEIRTWPDAGNVGDIEYLAFVRPDFDVLPAFPNLKAMLSRSAGVEAFAGHPRLPKVPVGKIEPGSGDPMMTEYVIMHVLRLHRELPTYHAAQARGEWLKVPVRRPEQRRIGFLGFGLMAKPPALMLQSLGFPVSSTAAGAVVPGFGDDLQDKIKSHLR